MINTVSPVQFRKDISLNMSSCAASTSTNSTAQTAVGAKPDMVFIVKRPSGLNAGLLVEANCNTKDQLVFTFLNATVGAIDPALLTYEVVGL